MVRFAVPRTAAALVVLCSMTLPSTASAQQPSPQPSSPPAPAAAHAAVAQLAPEAFVLPRPGEPSGGTRRPRALVPLYASFGALQVLDAHSTARAIAGGAVEVNPLMRPFAGNTAGMLAIKGAGTVGVIYATEKMWKKNKAGAIIFMVAANSAMAWIVQNNYRAVR